MGNKFGKARVPGCQCEDRFTCGVCLRAAAERDTTTPPTPPAETAAPDASALPFDPASGCRERLYLLAHLWPKLDPMGATVDSWRYEARNDSWILRDQWGDYRAVVHVLGEASTSLAKLRARGLPDSMSLAYVGYPAPAR